MSGEHEDQVGHPADRDRLAALQEDAAAVCAAIASADKSLRVLAARRVAAERDLRAWGGRHLAASRAAAAHALDRPGPFTQLASGFRGRREWRARQDAIESVIADTARPLDAARKALARAKDEFAAQLTARAELTARLRGLTAECAAAQEIAGEPACRDGRRRGQR